MATSNDPSDQLPATGASSPDAGATSSDTQAHAPTPASRFEYIEGALPEVSDARPVTAPLRSVVLALVPEDVTSVLLVGARAASLAADFVGRGLTVRVLVRGRVDAEAVAPTGASVVCGSLDRWTTPAQEAVVVLDPPSLLVSQDAAPMSSRAVMDWARRHATRTWICFVPNGFSMASLDLTPQAPKRVASADQGGRSSYGLGNPTLAALEQEGKHPAYFVLPDLDHPGAIVGRHALSNPRVSTLVRSALVDDERWDRALDADAVGTLAGGWLVVDGGAAAPPTVVTSMGGFSEPNPQQAQTVGTPFETTLRRALRAADLTATRTMLTDYLDWLEGLDSAAAVSAVPRNVVPAGEGYAVIAPRSVTLQPDVPPEVVRAVTIFDLACGLAQSPGSHPWGPGLPPEVIATELLRLAGYPSDARSAVTAAAQVHRSLDLRERYPAVSQYITPREAELLAALRDREAQAESLREELEKQRRHLRASERAIATESGSRAKRAYFLMTAPTSRLVEATKRRMRGD